MSSMLTCGVWVHRGVAKEIPDKVELTREDLNKILEETKEKLKEVDGSVDISKLEKECMEGELPTDEEDESSNDNENDEEVDEEADVGVKDSGDDEVSEEDEEEEDPLIWPAGDMDADDKAIAKEYGLEDYDDGGVRMTGAGMAGLIYFDNKEDDPYVDLKKMKEEDEEDLHIKPGDNLFVVGKMEDEFSCLDIYVYNEDEDNMYVHHDIVLESFPLCLEWLSYDAALEGKSGNYVAVGTMEPSIEVWDLDIIDTLEPAFVLEGCKKKKKKKKNNSTAQNEEPKVNGHTDAVLALAWNRNVTNVLASASADYTVRIWDMSTCTCVHTLTHHKEKVQSVAWHPYEAQSLLTGSFDGTCAVLDCRNPNVFKSWKVRGECEKAIWDQFNPFNFLCSTDTGLVHYMDVRSNAPVFTVNAHDNAVTGISLSSQLPNCLVSVSSDKNLKVWDYTDNKPTCVTSRNMKMGHLNFVMGCPDNSFIFGAGGEKDGLRMFNLASNSSGKDHFANRTELEASHTDMDTDDAFAKMNIAPVQRRLLGRCDAARARRARHLAPGRRLHGRDHLREGAGGRA